MTYSNILKKWFADSYQTHLINTAFSRCKEWITEQYYINNYKKTSEFYSEISKTAIARKSRRDKNSIIIYDVFAIKTIEFFKKMNIDDVKIDDINDVKKKKVKVAKQTKKELISDNKYKSAVSSTYNPSSDADDNRRVSVELLDGTMQNQSIDFWNTDYIYADNKSDAGNCSRASILEKNLFATDSKSYDFNLISTMILKSDAVPNFSLLVYNDLINGGKIVIYRKIASELIIVGEIKGSCLGYINDRLIDGKNKLDKIINQKEIF